MRARIFQIITRLILGGAQENTVLTCEGLHARGYEVTLITGPPLGSEGELLRRANRGGYRVAVVDSLRRAIHPWRDWRSYRILRRLIREGRPDVVHTHSSKAGILGRRAAWKLRVRGVVHTIHGLPFHEYQPAPLHHLYRAWERAAGTWCHRLVCVGEVMRDKAVAAGVAPRGKTAVVWSGMEVDPFLRPRDRASARRALGISAGKRVAGVIARLAPLKGHDFLFEAVRSMGLHLLLVGDGALRPALEARAKREGIAATFTGMMGPERIPDLLAAMDVLVHPSLREGLPRSVVQAIVSGVPAVAFDCDGAREVIRNGANGFLVAPGDSSALGEAIVRALDSSPVLSEEERRFFADRFRPERMVDSLESHYLDLLSRGLRVP